MKASSELDDSTAAAVVSIHVKGIYDWDRNAKKKIQVGALKRIKFADKGKNLERLGRSLGLFNPKLNTKYDDESAGRTIEELEVFAVNGRWPETVTDE